MTSETINYVWEQSIPLQNWLFGLSTDQYIAFGIIILSFMVFNLSVSASYKEERNGVVVKHIEKNNYIPNLTVKGFWVYVVYAFSYQLWIAAIIIVGSIVLIMANISKLQPILKLFQPTISEKEKRA